MNPTALVTGGGIRLGRALAIHLAQQGYDIALHCNRSLEQAHATAAEIRQIGADCEVFPYDFAQQTDFVPLAAAIQKRFPAWQVLVNNASVYESGTLMATNHAQLLQQFQVNLFAPYLLTQAFAQHVPKGHVINILDNKIAFQQYQYSAYLLSKKSLAEVTRLAALELAPHFRVNGIAPGVTLPAETRSEEYVKWRVQGIPLQRQGSPAQIASALQFLLDNPFVTGQIITVDGGEGLTQIGQNAASYGQADHVP